MRAPISVIIPTLNAGEDLPACLMALGEGLNEGVIRELIISDGGSSDTTLRTAEAAGAVIVTGPASRGAQMRRGAEAAEGDWLFFLRAHSQLAPGWTTAVKRHLLTDKAAAFRRGYRSGHPMGRVAAGWANLRSRLFGLYSDDQGLLIPRGLYQSIGGYPDLRQRDDLAIARALRGQITLLSATVIPSGERYGPDG